MMRLLSALLATCLAFPQLVSAASPPLIVGEAGTVPMPEIEVVGSGTDRLDLVFELPALAVEEVAVGGRRFDAVSIPGGGSTGPLGTPALPTFTRLVEIPDRSGIVITPIIEEEEELTGFALLPMTGYAEEPFLYDEAAYSRDDFSDQPPVRTGDPAILRGRRIVPLRFQPVRYNPVRGVLKVARRIRVEVSFEGVNLVNPGSARAQRAVPPSFDRLYRSVVINYEGSGADVGMAPGSYIVICPDDNDVVTRLQPLLDWRERQGYPVRLATTAETGTTTSEIKAWIQAAYDTWETPPEYIVLVGDATTPYRVRTWFENLSGYHGEGDHPYVQLDGDDVLADAHIGRLSFSTLTELEAIINKIVGYESTPELSDPDWYRRACLVGDPGASGYSTVIVQQWIKDRIRDLGWTQIDTIYASPFVSQMTDALNQGDTIFSYRGYLGMSGWTNSNSYALQNGSKMPFAVTITCDTGSFADGTSRTEGLLRANAGADAPRGAIGSIGTATWGTHTRFNNCVHYGIFRGLLYEEQYTLGAALTRGKMEMYLNYSGIDDDEVLIWSHWNNLMGDPATECWTGFPEPLSVTHDAQVPLGANSFAVTVEQAGSPLAEARVCILGEGSSQSVGFTDAQGFLELPIRALTPGAVLLTITKHDAHPYLVTIPIVAEEVYVGYNSSLIDDDNTGGSSGNGDGIANPNEGIELRVQLQNFGTQLASDVTATLTSDDPYVTILDGDESFGDIAGGAVAWTADDFDISIDPACPNGRILRFGLDISAGTEQWHSLLDLPVVAADLVADGSNLYNAGANGILDPGETVDLGVVLGNEGGATATDVTGTLISLSSYITVLDETGSWGTIPEGAQTENSGDLFTVEAAAETYPGHLATFQLITSFSDGLTDTTLVAVTVGERQSEDPIGPDSYGYLAFDDTDVAYAEAPVYDWVEIDPSHGGSGQIVPLDDYGTYEDDSVVIDLPFPFRYYGELFTKATICSNGWMTMGSTWLVNYRNWTIPAAGGPDGILALLWDDLRLQAGGKVYQYYDEVGHRFIVEWSRLRNEVGYTTTIELILYDPAFHPTVTGDGVILFQYDTVSNNNYTDNCATVGIESPDGTDGLLYTFFDAYPAGAAPLEPGRAIRFLPVSEMPTGLIRGEVRNASYGGAPLPGVEITLVEAERTFLSDQDGFYNGMAVIGTYTVTATLAGFEPVTVEGVEILQDEVTILDFDLVDVVGPAITTTTHESTSDTVGPYPIPVVIIEYSGLAEKTLYWRVYGGSFAALELLPQGGNDYLAEIPGQEYVTQIEYYVYARDDLGQESTDPAGAPEDLHSFIVTPIVDLFVDDMEADQGWTVGAEDDDATGGIWERVDPEATWSGQTMVQPEDDHTEDPGVLCFVTDGRGGAQGEFDVDGGKTTLTSPLLDLTSTATVKLRYYRWYTNDTGFDSEYGDLFAAEISSDGGRQWVEIESTTASDRSWRLVEVNDLSELIELSDRVRIRFVASDYGEASVVEAAIDDVALVLSGIVGAPGGSSEPIVFSLMPSRPNPSRAGVTIRFALERTGDARLFIYDVQGRTIRRLIDERRPAGAQSILWDGKDDHGEPAPSGVYFYRLDAGGSSHVRKLLRLE